MYMYSTRKREKGRGKGGREMFTVFMGFAGCFCTKGLILFIIPFMLLFVAVVDVVIVT